MGQQICPATSNSIELETSLLPFQFEKYKSEPYTYILQIMKKYSSQHKDKCNLRIIFSKLIILLQQCSISQPHPWIRRHDTKAIDKYMIQYKMKQQLSITDQQRIYILIAAYAHDNGHQGLTNNFYIQSQSDLAIKYSYLSPLQNMHSSNLLRVLKEHKIVVKQSMRKLMIELILATDNKHHNYLLNKIKQYQNLVNSRVIKQFNDVGDEDMINKKREEHHDHKDSNQIVKQMKERQKQYRPVILQLLIHTADLNNCGKPLDVYLKWNQRLSEEFKAQYQKQKQYDYKNKIFSHFDLKNWQICNVNSNVSFFNNMVLPLFKEVMIIMPDFRYQLDNSVKIRNYYQKKGNQIKGKINGNGQDKQKYQGKQKEKQNSIKQIMGQMK